MKFQLLSRVKSILSPIKKAIIVEFQYRFLGKTGFGDELLRLREFRVYHKKIPCNAKDPILYLTLDVEWDQNPYFAQMLDALKDRKVCAYMFVLAKGMEEHADLLHRIVAEGHCAGNHTLNHPNLTKCSHAQVLEELKGCQDTFHSLTGQQMPKVLRPPFGRINRPLAKLLFQNGYTVMHWSLHVPDYGEEQPVWEDYKRYLKERLHNGGIILQHSFSSATAENLGNIIDFCREMGYRFAEKEDFEDLLSNG